MTNALKQYVASTSTRVDRLRPPDSGYRAEWGLVNALLGGTRAMREAGELFLPRFPKEEPLKHSSRLAQSTLYNVFARTVSLLASKPFRSPPMLENARPELVEWLDDVDLQGRNLATFARSLLRTGLAKGMAHVLVDFPRQQLGATLADERAAGARPYLTEVRPEDVVSFVAGEVNGRARLIALRLAFTRSQPSKDDPFVPETVAQLLEIERGTAGCPWQLKEKQPGADDYAVVAEGIITTAEIPFVTFYAQREGYMVACPPLLDLAYLNLQHWQSASDQDNILHVARVPILFAAGFADDEQLTVGASSAVRTSNAQATLAFIEHSGAAIEAGRASLQDVEARMAALGAELLLKRQTGDKSATEAAIESAEATCDLSAIVEALEDALNYAFDFMGEYVGLPSPGTVTFFKDFAVAGLSASDVPALLQLQAAGVISKAAVFKEAQRRSVLSDDLDFNAEQVVAEEETAADLERAIAQQQAMAQVAGGEPQPPEGG